MSKFGKFLIFIGLLLVGVSCYQMFVGDIPFIDNVFNNIGTKEDSEVVGPRIEVDKISTIDYSPTVGNVFNYDKEEFQYNDNNSFSMNIMLGNEPYKLSFKYSDYLSLLTANNTGLVIGDTNTLKMTFNNTSIKPEEYLKARSNITSDDEYFYKTYTANNKVSKIYITNIYERLEHIYINKATYLIYALNEEGNALDITMITSGKKIPDGFLINFYNNLTFEKIDTDFKFCKIENNKYVCSLKLNNYDNSSKEVFSLEFDADLYDITEEDNNLIPSSVIIKTKEGSSNTANVSVDIEYDSNGVRKKQLEASYYDDAVINGRNARVRNYASNPNKKVYNYEIKPNTFLRIEVDASDGFFDTVSNTFNGFQVK